MKNAKELLEEFTAASFRDPKKAAELFTEDGAFEMPYLESVGVPGRYEGRRAIEDFFRYVRELYPGMDLKMSKSMIDTPEQALLSTSSPRNPARPDASSTNSFSGVWSQRM